MGRKKTKQKIRVRSRRPTNKRLVSFNPAVGFVFVGNDFFVSLVIIIVRNTCTFRVRIFISTLKLQNTTGQESAEVR